MLKYFWAAWVLLVIGYLSTGCGGSSTPPASVRSGKIKIAADETFKPIVEIELDAYRQANPKLEIIPVYASEAEVLRLFLNDSVQLALLPDKLSKSHTDAVFSQIKITPKSTWFASDGIVLITHPDRERVEMKLSDLTDVLSGKITDWEGLKSKPGGKIEVVLDQNNSSLVRYMSDSLLKGSKPGTNIYAAKSNLNVIEHVSKKTASVGFIGYNWLSNEEDPATAELAKKVKQVAFIHPDNGKAYDLGKDVIYRLAYGRYPLKRNIYIHNRETSVGPSTGLSAFLAGKEGQLIAHKAGLIPASGMIRLVEMKEGKIPEVVKE